MSPGGDARGDRAAARVNRALVLHANLSPLVVKFRTPWRRWSYRLGRLPLAPRPLPPAVPELVPQWAGPELEGPSDAAA